MQQLFVFITSQYMHSFLPVSALFMLIRSATLERQTLPVAEKKKMVAIKSIKIGFDLFKDYSFDILKYINI